MKILSLFDWIACWYEALQRAWIPIDKYYASEVDKYAIQIATKNHPDIIEIWDVKDIFYEGWLLQKYMSESRKTNIWVIDNWPIDLLIWGSPCQWFSVAGKMLNFNDPRSKLFFEYVRLLREVKPKYFLLENVKMKKEWQDIISRELWVEPIEINSALVSWQQRKRLYRTNIPGITQPEDKGILLKDVLQNQVDEEYYYSNERRNKILARKYEVTKRLEELNSKCATLVTTGGGDHEKKIAVSHCPASREFDGQGFRTDKVPTLCARDYKDAKVAVDICTKRIRKLTPIEYERLQTLPDNYTEWVSKTQRYKMLGNWWTVDVIAHIFRFIP